MTVLTMFQLTVFQNASIKTPFEASMDGIFTIDYAPSVLQLVFTSRCLKFKTQAYVSKLFFWGEGGSI